jgi:hypothetical protein|uniref:Uncharacterized protein n=1 Tax=viral metagenome TaxID=1070528 RepID=A0A6C0AJY1_9ZZZZ
MKNSNRVLLIVVAFVIGLVFCSTIRSKDVVEGFNNNNDCPNLLVKKGNVLILTNTGKAEIPGVNPIKFNNLEEYVEFLEWQRKMGVKCPVLYFEETYDAQGKVGYKMMHDVMDKRGGLPTKVPEQFRQAPVVKLRDSNRNDQPYNNNNFAGFDSDDQHVGIKTPLDQVQFSGRLSDNAMDSNWGGIKHSEHSVESGTYEERMRKPTSFTVKETFLSKFKQVKKKKMENKEMHPSLIRNIPQSSK